MTVTPNREPSLFDPGPATPAEIMTKTLEGPVWSENKADLIAKYLRYFTFITRHGTYIDAFAGPQSVRSAKAWTAQRVLANEPRWLRHFRLFDKSPSQVRHLQHLADGNTERDVQIYQGDSNQMLREVLPVGSIREREATFCLLDQRTFQCEWELCQHVSQLRPGRFKVEQFYFLANWWMPRALSATSTPEGEQRVQAWLGQEDWRPFRELSLIERAEVFVDKFKNELGYRSVKPWPIYKREAGKGPVMYYMIHATDHKEAPKLMYRAYRKAISPPEPVEQLELALSGFALDGAIADS